MEKPADKRPQILQPSGGYEKLVSFQVAKLLYAVTVRFVDRYIPAGSRTADQMEQAARSGERNIGEGSKISATTKKLELNLTSVARASIDELRKDYEAYLEHRKLPAAARLLPDTHRGGAWLACSGARGLEMKKGRSSTSQRRIPLCTQSAAWASAGST